MDWQRFFSECNSFSKLDFCDFDAFKSSPIFKRNRQKKSHRIVLKLIKKSERKLF